MSSSWLWQPFGLLFLFDNVSYFAILFASHQWFGEQRGTTIFLEEIAHPCLETLKLATLHR